MDDICGYVCYLRGSRYLSYTCMDIRKERYIERRKARSAERGANMRMLIRRSGKDDAYEEDF